MMNPAAASRLVLPMSAHARKSPPLTPVEPDWQQGLVLVCSECDGGRGVELAAEKIVEGGEEDQREKPRDGEHDAEGSRKVDATRFRMVFGIARFVDLDEKQVRSEEHTSELQSLMRISYAVFCLKKKKK